MKFCRSCHEMKEPIHHFHKIPIYKPKFHELTDLAKAENGDCDNNNNGDSEFPSEICCFDIETVETPEGVLEPLLCCAQMQSDPKNPKIFWTDEDENESCVTQFIRWVINYQNSHNYSHRLIILAHNNAKFDGVSVLRSFLVDLKLCPKILVSARKILLIELPTQRIYFKDTYLFFNIPLSKVGAAFEIESYKTW